MEITEARHRLEAERDRLVALRESQGEDGSLDEEQADSSGSLADYDQHPGDQGTETFERTKDLAVREQIDERLRSEEHTSELQSRPHLVCRLLLEKKKEHE